MRGERNPPTGLALGRFHEWSTPTGDILASIAFYERLGFTQASTREVWPHPYAALTDGRISIGLHQNPRRPASLTFVLPDVAKRSVHLEQRGMAVEYRHTGTEMFHEVGLSDPSGQRIVLLEARTYSPTARSAGKLSHCGYFAALSVPVADFESARRFWEPLGFVAGPETSTPFAHVRLTSDHLNIVLHQPSLHVGPLLLFTDEGLERRVTQLRDLGLRPSRLSGRVGPGAHALLEAPEGTRILVLGAEI